MWAQSLWGAPLLKPENGHNSKETWLRLRLLPLSRHASPEYFIPSPPRDGEQSKSNVYFLSRRFPSAADTFLLRRICALIKVLLLTGSVCSLRTLILYLCQAALLAEHWIWAICNCLYFHDKLNDGQNGERIPEWSHNRPFQPHQLLHSVTSLWVSSYWHIAEMGLS